MPDTQQENAKNLKNLGLKATGPRLKILEIFQERAKAGEDRHLSAEEVYKELVNVGEDVGLATVYRVLAQFASAGILTRRNFEHGTAVFELDDGCAARSSNLSMKKSKNAKPKLQRNTAMSWWITRWHFTAFARNAENTRQNRSNRQRVSLWQKRKDPQFWILSFSE